MSMIPEELKYTKEHEWLRLEDDVATVGITDYAQSELGDIVYVELPEVGKKFLKGEAVCTVEAVKTAADIYAPVSGEILEVNSELEDHPELINKDPYGKGWIFKMKITNRDELKELLSAQEYRKHIGE